MSGFGQSESRAIRLMSLSAVLQLGRPITLRELRRRFGLYDDGDADATRRMFERDKADLRRLGLDVQTIRVGDEDGYRVKNSGGTARIRWTDDEAVTLAILATASLDPDASVAIAKVAVEPGVYPTEPSGRIDVRMDLASSLTRAVVERRRVAFSYRNTKGRVEERRVEPWALATRRGLTYLTGWDLGREAARVYRLDRVLSAVRDAGEATHERPSQGELGIDLHPDARTTVELEIPPERITDARMIGARIDEQDGVVRAIVEGIREEVAVGWTLRHRAVVVAPDTLAAEVAQRRGRLRQRHEGDPALAPLELGEDARRPRLAGLSDSRLARLLALPAWLEARPGVTVEETASAFACDRQDVLAELDLLDRVELPGIGNLFERDVDAEGHVDLRTVVATRTAALTHDDTLRLLTVVEAAAALLPHEAKMLDRISHKLRDALPPGARGIDVLELGRPAVESLRAAIEDGLSVVIEYRGRRDPAHRSRRVRPLQLQLIDGGVYLAAEDLDLGESRTFKVDRIASIERLDGQVTAGSLPPLPDYVPNEDEVDVELLLGPRGTWILGVLPAVASEARPDGAVHVLVRTDVPEWLLGHVRAAGGDAEVLRPPRLRRELLDSVDPAVGEGRTSTEAPDVAPAGDPGDRSREGAS